MEHLVYFPKPVRNNDLYYFDITTQKWLKLEIRMRCPYELGNYRCENGKILILPSDCYLFSDKPDGKIEVEAWRDEIKAGTKLDFYYKNEWVQAKVAWMKSDVTEGVMLLDELHRAISYGYFHKYSKRVQKLNTHTPVLNENEIKEECETTYDKCTLYISKFKNILPRYAVKNINNENYIFYDIRIIYDNLTQEQIEITDEVLLNTGKLKEGTDLSTMSNTTKLYIWFNLYKNIHVAYRSNKIVPQNNIGYFDTKCDAIFDIKVKNATYAVYSPKNGCIEGTIQNIPLIKDGNDFILEGATYDTPLFRSMSGDTHSIKTDGNVIEYKELLLEPNSGTIFTGFNSHGISWLSNDTIIMLGHLWMPSAIVKSSDIELVNE